MYPKSFLELIESLKYLPGIGDKTAERLAFSIFHMDEEKTSLLSESINDVKTKVKKCTVCNNLTEEDKCSICLNNNRNNEVLCIVDDPRNIIMFEKLGTYNGYYHVLDGLISPIDGITPEEIGIDKLLKRIRTSEYKEIILALRPSIEGETTSLYIKRLIEDLPIEISKIANGIPIGAEMDYIDSLTLERALNDRRSF